MMTNDRTHCCWSSDEDVCHMRKYNGVTVASTFAPAGYPRGHRTKRLTEWIKIDESHRLLNELKNGSKNTGGMRKVTNRR